MITTARLTHPSAYKITTFFVYVVRTFKLHSLINFQVHDRRLLTIVIMLNIRSPEHIHLITRS